MAEGHRLDRFADLSMIDNIVKESCGKYSHDEVFDMEVEFVYTLKLMYYEKSCYNKRFEIQNRIYNE